MLFKHLLFPKLLWEVLSEGGSKARGELIVGKWNDACEVRFQYASWRNSGQGLYCLRERRDTQPGAVEGSHQSKAQSHLMQQP